MAVTVAFFLCEGLAMNLAQPPEPALDASAPVAQSAQPGGTQAQASGLLPAESRQGNRHLLLWLTELNATHPRILAAEAAVKAAEHQRGVARSRLMPNVDAKVDLGRENISPPLAQDTSMSRQVASISARQLVYDFGGVPGSIDKAAADRDMALTQLAQTRQSVIHQGITAYLNLLKTRESVANARLSVESVQRLSGIEDAMVARGVALSYDALQMKAQLIGARANLLRAERNHVVALNAFAAAFGFTPSAQELQHMGHPVPAKATVPTSLDLAVATALTSHPQLVVLKHARESRRAELKTNEAAFFPRFDVLLEGLHRHNDQGVAGLRTEGRASLQFGWSLFSGNRDTEKVKAAKANLAALLRTELDRRNLVEEQSRNAWSQMVSARQSQQINQNQSALLKAFLGQLDQG
ncbi:MAG: hypothetical protein C0405_11830, partial [Desulfovibrio sp.]|nr:hypothetical protein [Desulfovibrio sp.]